jgi:branched-chain amino acid transport system substrate-binding protein
VGKLRKQASQGQPMADGDRNSPGGLTRRSFVGAAGLGALATLLSPAAILAACGGGSTAGGASKPDIIMGGIYPLTGPNAGTAKSWMDGSGAYVKYVNDNGGVNGSKIKWLVEDDAQQAARTIAGARKLIQQDNAVMICSTYATGDTLQVLPTIAELKVPLLAIPAFSTVIYRPVQRYSFACWPGNADTGAPQTNYFLSQGAKRFAQMGKNDSGTSETLTGYAKPLSADQIVAKSIFEPNTTDFTTIAQRMVAAKPDVVQIYGQAPEMAQAILALRSQGFTGPVMGGTTTSDPTWLKLLPDKSLGNKVYGVVAVDSFGGAKGWSKYEAAMKKYTTTDPAAAGPVSGWVGMMIAVEVLKRASGNYSSDNLVKSFETLSNFDTGGFTGPVSFSPTKHVAVGSVRLTQAQDGKIVPIGKFVPM